jgi:hypothetical protein
LLDNFIGRFVAIALCVTLLAAPWPRSSRASSAPPPKAADPSADSSTRDTIPLPTNPHFLRDAVPTAGFASEPEDSTDDEFLPEEGNTKKLVWDIAAWVVGAALVAFFIIKVFIEEEPDEPETGGGTKPDPF